MLLISCAGNQVRPENYTVGVVLDTGGVEAFGFNQAAWQGAQAAARDFSLGVSYRESDSAADYLPNIEYYSSAGTNLIWGVGSLLIDDMRSAAINNSELDFAIIDYAPVEGDPDNLYGAIFADNEAAFLVGYIAGKMTESNILGIILGMDIPVLEPFESGFIAGALRANPGVKILKAVANSFSDSSLGQTIGARMYGAGADIIYSAAGVVGDGAMAAAREAGKWFIGTDKDMALVDPDITLSSTLKNVQGAVQQMTDALYNGEELPNKSYFDLANGGVDFSTTGGHIRAGVIDEANALKAEIIAVTLNAPKTLSELQTVFPSYSDSVQTIE
jgi:basic membrane protein A